MIKFIRWFFAFWLVVLTFLVLVPSAQVLFSSSPDTGTYELVVTNTLAGLFGNFIAVIVGYAFVKGGWGVVNNFVRAKKGDALEKISFF